MSRILVTGATGFVGRAVIAALRRDGHTLSGTTRQADLVQGPEGIPLYKIAGLGHNMEWAPVVAGANIVVHLAARVHVMEESAGKPRMRQEAGNLAAHMAVNADGTRRLAEAAAEAGVRRFLFVSTVKVMGEETISMPFTESDGPAPEDAYGVSKLKGEAALTEVAARTGMKITVLRPPSVYGPQVAGNFLRILKLCDSRVPLPIASIRNARSLISVANLSSAVAVAAVHPAAAGEIFLVSDGEDVSTPELFRRVAVALGCRARQFGVPVPIMEIAGALIGRGGLVRRLTRSLAIDGEKIRQKLGWTPVETLDQGLVRTAQWFRG
jgi:nucleoside-diphosphate-sugar epimerase